MHIYLDSVLRFMRSQFLYKRKKKKISKSGIKNSEKMKICLNVYMKNKNDLAVYSDKEENQNLLSYDEASEHQKNPPLCKLSTKIYFFFCLFKLEKLSDFTAILARKKANKTAEVYEHFDMYHDMMIHENREYILYV